MKIKIQGKKILVTGGAGFIGSNLTESLLAQGNSVRCLDNFSTGKPENIREFEGEGGFEVLEGDIRDYETCLKAVKNIDIVFHEAALGSVPRSIKDPVSSVDVNIGGFTKMLFASREAHVKRFIYASSSSVYGDNADLPKTEGKTGNQLSPYAITKYTDELLGNIFSKVYGMEVIGLRYFNVFGKKQDPEGVYAAVIPKFILSLLQHKSPVINGDGSVSRDFTYVENVINANILAAICDGIITHEVFNVACNDSTTIASMYFTIRELLAAYDNEIKSIEPVYGPEREGDIKHSLASIDKISNILGYYPVINTYLGLSKTVEWFLKKWE